VRVRPTTRVAGVVAAALLSAGAAYTVHGLVGDDGAAIAPDLERGYRVTADGRHRSVSVQWSGYAVTGGRTTQAAASFRVPMVHCTGNANASFWVGLDGIRSRTVEQAGVQALCRSGKAVYSAWSQFYPDPAEDYPVVVRAGDAVGVRVTCDETGTAVLELTVNGAVYTTTKSVPGARLASAEVIAEQSGAVGDPLSPFDPVTFTGVQLGGVPLAESGAHTLDMLDVHGRLRALPGAVVDDGFTVTRP
jgi:hypothetical protein